MIDFPKRGEIWLIQFDPKVGSEQGGTRASRYFYRTILVISTLLRQLLYQ